VGLKSSKIEEIDKNNSGFMVFWQMLYTAKILKYLLITNKFYFSVLNNN
jgi:hypothetical protein